MKSRIIISLFIILALSLVIVYADNNSANQTAPCGVGDDGTACPCLSSPAISKGCDYSPIYNNGCIMGYDIICLNTTQKCANEGEYTSGAVSPEYYFGCCSGLKAFNPRPGIVGGRDICYNPNKGTPVCQFSGTRSEGWYYSSGELLRYDSCSTTTSCASHVCEDGSIPRCYEQEGGGCICESCPSIIIDPICGNGICESGEGEICVSSAIACQAGKECSVPPTKCFYRCEQDCKNIPGIYGKLNEKFKLEVNQVVKFEDYKNMKMTFRDLITQKCESGIIGSNQVQERIQTVQASISSSSEKDYSASNFSASVPASGGSADMDQEEGSIPIIKCPNSSPIAQLEIEFPTLKERTILNLQLGESKRVQDVFIVFLGYDYASRTGTFIVKSGNDYDCPANCICDENGNTIACHSLPICESGKIMCPDGICREKCENSSVLNCDYGCLYNNKCLTVGTRAEGLFCSISGDMTSQLGSDGECENNFECSTNLCLDGKCISSGFIQRFFNWFRKLFGGGDKENKVDLKACQADEECAVKYNILFENKCSAGCFDKNTQVDSSCDLKWQPIAGICKCVKNQCELKSI